MAEERPEPSALVEEQPKAASRNQPDDSHLLTARSGRIKAARRLADRRSRRELGRFLVEGPQVLAEAYAVPGAVEEVYSTPAAAERYAGLRAASPVQWQLADERAVASLADTVTPTGVVAVCRSGFVTDLAGQIAPDADLIVLCADVRDPGNAGTIIRTADAAGADLVQLAGQSVDVGNPKAVRATAGSLFHLPVTEPEATVADTIAGWRADGWAVLAADGGGEVDLFEADDLLRGRTVWLLGNEAWGLPAETAALADHRVRIPILGRAESLNLAAAAAVCLYATARAQRS
ncbi:MAG: RNA methyltransferase [Nocardioides sp.]